MNDAGTVRHAGGGVAQRLARRVVASPAWRRFSQAVKAVNALTGHLAGLLILASCAIITNEVVWRYYLHRPHTWNLELNIFLLIGATFLGANYTQMKRGHVGTEVLETVMPARWNRRRILLGDVISLLLCAFFAVKVLEYAWQAWSEGWTTDSVWAPQQWIPYSLMGVGLALLTLAYVVQITEEIAGGGAPGEAP